MVIVPHVLFLADFLLYAHMVTQNTASTRSENDNRAAAGLGNARAGRVLGSTVLPSRVAGRMFWGYLSPCEKSVDRVGMDFVQRAHHGSLNSFFHM